MASARPQYCTVSIFHISHIAAVLSVSIRVLIWGLVAMVLLEGGFLSFMSKLSWARVSWVGIESGF